MAYFGDATAHAAILGVAISLAFQISIISGVLGVTLAMAFTVWAVSGRGFASDTILGVISYSALAFGLVAVSALPDVRVDLNAYLFGDILSVARDDLVLIWIGAGLICCVVFWRWSIFLTATLNLELAKASGLRPRREGLLLTLLLAIAVAVAIKVVGALLIGALLIIPAAAARPFSSSPERMAISATILGVVSAIAGLRAAFVLDTPAGPTIVCTAAILFALTNIGGAIFGPK